MAIDDVKFPNEEWITRNHNTYVVRNGSVVWIAMDCGDPYDAVNTEEQIKACLSRAGSWIRIMGDGKPK